MKMYALQRIATKIQRLAPVVLILCFVYQLGACPCGCLDHNFWLQALGLQHEDESSTAANEVQLADDHECDGRSGPHFVDNSTSVPALKTVSQIAIYGVTGTTQQGISGQVDRLGSRTKDVCFSNHTLAFLQVFRI